MLRRFILLLILQCVFGFAYCQDSIFTYQCDFEDVVEREKWEDNAGPKGAECANKWYFGRPGANGGDYGLFVSRDGTSNNYDASGVTVVSYREFDSLKVGVYEFSFDWRAGGWQDSQVR